MRTLPEQAGARGRLTVRRLRPADAAALGRAVAESLEHLRPWMAWTAQEPLDLPQRRAMLEEWERDWRAGGDVTMGAFLDGALVGGAGIHRRIGAGGLELGYWIHPGHLRRGLATEVALRLTDAAFAVPGITHVEIHHDRANAASRGVAAKLGYELIAEVADGAESPAEEGVECRWRMERDAWLARGAQSTDSGSWAR